MFANQENIPPATSLKLKIPGKFCTSSYQTAETKGPTKQTKWSPENSAELIRVLTEQQAAGTKLIILGKGVFQLQQSLHFMDWNSYREVPRRMQRNVTVTGTRCISKYL